MWPHMQLNIASSNIGSRISLNASSADEEDDDDFGDAISMVHGLAPPNISKKKHRITSKERRKARAMDNAIEQGYL